jgi:hypothetical protein
VIAPQRLLQLATLLFGIGPALCLAPACTLLAFLGFQSLLTSDIADGIGCILMGAGGVLGTIGLCMSVVRINGTICCLLLIGVLSAVANLVSFSTSIKALLLVAGPVVIAIVHIGAFLHGRHWN